MNRHLQKATLLFEHRPKLAAKELLSAIAEEPDNSYLHAFLSLCLQHSSDKEGALREANLAIELNPEESLAFYALAKYHILESELENAEKAIAEALRIDPLKVGYWGLLSGIRFERGALDGALEAAAKGLQVSPVDIHCHNLKALIQVKLGQTTEARRSLDTSMELDPENASTHAYRGWSLIENYDHAGSIYHFREALRIDPSLEWARLGMLQALAISHWMFQLRLWLLNGRAEVLACFLLILLLAIGFLVKTPNEIAAQIVVIAKLICILSVFCLLLLRDLPNFTVSSAALSAILLFDRNGRILMTKEEKISNIYLFTFSVAFFIALAGAFVFKVTWPPFSLIILFFISAPFIIQKERRSPLTWLGLPAFAIFAAVFWWLLDQRLSRGY